MLLGHGVVDRQEHFIFHPLQGEGVFPVGFICFQRRQSHAAAADKSITGGMDHIAADGTHIELAPQQIGRAVSVGDLLAVHQFNDGDAQGLSQGLQQRNIRQTLVGFPFGNSLAADADPIGQFCLGQLPFFPKLTDDCARYVGVHI